MADQRVENDALERAVRATTARHVTLTRMRAGFRSVPKCRADVAGVDCSARVRSVVRRKRLVRMSRARTAVEDGRRARSFAATAARSKNLRQRCAQITRMKSRAVTPVVSDQSADRCLTWTRRPPTVSPECRRHPIAMKDVKCRAIGQAECDGAFHTLGGGGLCLHKTA